ncbi:HDA1 complex subunit 3 [[Candida] anglica]
MDLLKILDSTPEPPIIDSQLSEINTSGDYNLPTPMFEFQKELTDQIVSLHYPDILKFSETNDSNDSVVKSLEICYNNCISVSVHPYLLINHYMPKNLAQKDMSSKLAETSGKFHVLKDLMNVIISNEAPNKNVAIVMNNNNKYFDLAEALLLGCKGDRVIKRYVGNHVKKEGGKGRGAAAAAVAAAAAASTASEMPPQMTVLHLLPHDGEGICRDQELLRGTKFDVLVVFDSYVDTEHEFVRGIRQQMRGLGEVPATIIRLVPMKTIEHCQLFYKEAWKGAESEKKENSGTKLQTDYLYKLISSIVCLREQIGFLPPDLIPIYNQNLTYLSHTFFDELFKRSTTKAAAWSLPELPSIQYFSPIDVERSLLTEVHYHYTPYDTTGNGSGTNTLVSVMGGGSTVEFNDSVNTYEESKKKTYYELRRSGGQSYVTNPLTNDMNSLLGIFPGENISGENKQQSLSSNTLTHKLIMRMNSTYLQWKLIQQEHNRYLEFHDEKTQKKVGRREKDTQQSLSTIINDVDHAKTRITAAEKRYGKLSSDIEQGKEELRRLEGYLDNFIEEYSITSPKLKQYYENQKKIWEIQANIQDSITKISAKHEEKSFMATEYVNALKSTNEFKEQIEQVTKSNEETKRKLEENRESQEKEELEFKKQKKVLVDQLEPEKKRREVLRAKLGKSWKFLRHTSHLKKRKGRGITPGK